MEEKFIKAADGTEIFMRKDEAENPKGVVVIVHGLAEHLGRYDYVVEKLINKGFSVYRFDNRGHGKSGGRKGDLDDFQKYLDDADMIVETALNENKNLPVFMFGHSMGGLITTAYGAKYPGKLKGQITSGACNDFLPVFNGMKNMDKEKDGDIPVPNALSALISRDKEVVEKYDSDPLVLKEMTSRLIYSVFIEGIEWLHKNIINYEYPCLILHGEDDRIVPKECSEWMYNNIYSIDKHIKFYPLCYHEILNEKEEKDEVIEDIIGWMSKRVF